MPVRTIKLMADYDCWPLWEQGSNEYNVDPAYLPISDDLRADLLQWGDAYDATLNRHDPARSGFSDPEAEGEWKLRGKSLANRLREEIGRDHEIVEDI